MPLSASSSLAKSGGKEFLHSIFTRHVAMRQAALDAAFDDASTSVAPTSSQQPSQARQSGMARVDNCEEDLRPRQRHTTTTAAVPSGDSTHVDRGDPGGDVAVAMATIEAPAKECVMAQGMEQQSQQEHPHHTHEVAGSSASTSPAPDGPLLAFASQLMGQTCRSKRRS